MNRLALAFLVLLTLLFAGPALAGDHPDFTGTWVLDLDASQPLEPLLKAQGRSYPERKLADSVVITQVITQSEGRMVLDISSVASQRQEVLELDGVARNQQTERAGTVSTKAYWSPDGQRVITETAMTLADGRPAQMVATRSLADGGRTTHLLLELRLADGQVLKADRVLRKQ